MNENSQSKGSSQRTSYVASDLYAKAWGTIKKNIKPLIGISLLGVIVSVVFTALLTTILVNNLTEAINDTNSVVSAITTGLLALGVFIIASVFITLLQVVALKKATEGKVIQVSEVINESKNYIFRAITYGAFIMFVVFSSAMLIGLISIAVAPIGLLLGLALIVVLVLAAFRYAFLQFIIIEPAERPFLERFEISKKLTDNIYGTLFVIWIIGFLIGIGGAIVSTTLTSPLNVQNQSSTSPVITNGTDSDEQEELLSVIEQELGAVEDDSLNINGILSSTITTTISGLINLVVLGAMLELYRQRKKEVKVKLD